MLVPPEKDTFLNLLQSRQVFAYPTEAVYGLGGDPRAPEVFAEILRLKGARVPGQGRLLVAADWAQCADWVADLDDALIARLHTLAAARATTFILPATDAVPAWLRDAATGRIAIRVSTHPLVRQLCTWAGVPLISTSANPSGAPPARTAAEVQHYFPAVPVIAGTTGGEARPSRLWDVANAAQLRD